MSKEQKILMRRLLYAVLDEDINEIMDLSRGRSDELSRILDWTVADTTIYPWFYGSALGREFSKPKTIN